MTWSKSLTVFARIQDKIPTVGSLLTHVSLMVDVIFQKWLKHYENRRRFIVDHNLILTRTSFGSNIDQATNKNSRSNVHKARKAIQFGNYSNKNFCCERWEGSFWRKVFLFRNYSENFWILNIYQRGTLTSKTLFQPTKCTSSFFFCMWPSTAFALVSNRQLAKIMSKSNVWATNIVERGRI